MQAEEVWDQLEKIYDSHYEAFLSWLRNHRHLPTIIQMALKGDIKGLDQKLAIIWARDHFSTDIPDADDCIAEFIGIIVDESKNYLKLRHIKADIHREDSGEEYHKVMKSAIIDKLIFPFRVSSIFGLTKSQKDDP